MKKIRELLGEDIRDILLLSSTELDQDPILSELVGDRIYEQSYNDNQDYRLTSCYYVVGDNHPNISLILLRVRNPVWIEAVRD